jgi:XTP/dITP diphosphohydrolase
LWFSGNEPLEIRMRGDGKKFGPGEIPFHMPDLIVTPELPGWWRPGSVESWYQSNKFLESKEQYPLLETDIYFVTSNQGKLKSAQLALENIVTLRSLALDIEEEADTIEKIATHKANVAYATLCRPVMCDDSGFVIPALNGYPGHHVARELRDKGIGHFLSLAKDAPLESYFIMTLGYRDETLAKPALFTSRVDGTLISEQRGDLAKPFVKSSLFGSFILKGHTKTLAEFDEEEYKRHASSDRWKRFTEFLKSRV